MTLSTAELEAVVRDLKPKLEGGRIERIDQPDRHKLVLSVRKGGARYWLLICAHPRFSRMHLLTSRPEKGPPAAGFCNVVRQHMTSAPVQTVRQVPNDRVVVIESLERDRLLRPHRVSLVAELVGVGSNLVLLDESGRALGALFREDSARRRLVPGAQYQPLELPATLPDKARINRFEDVVGSEDPLSLSAAIQAHYAGLEAVEELTLLRAELLGALGAALKSRRRRLRAVTQELRRAEDAESIRRRGELLKTALPRIERGQREVVVENLFEPRGQPVTIELNPALSPAENMDWLFGRYKKAKAGRDKLAARADQTQREMEALEALEGLAQQAEDVQPLVELKSRARKAGVVFPEDRARRARRVGPKGPRLFRSAQGLEILVARSQAENERLTFSIARGNDYWMHLVGWPGPHVVIRKPADKSVSPDDLLDAAHLAIHFSKIRGAEHAEVVYTQCKNVQRLKGAGAGKVSYSGATNMRIRFDTERLERLFRPRDDMGASEGP